MEKARDFSPHSGFHQFKRIVLRLMLVGDARWGSVERGSRKWRRRELGKR